jgi:hypothetical protein
MARADVVALPVVRVPRVVLPVTARVPLEVNDDVAVILPPVMELEVIVVMKALIAEKKEATRPVEVEVPVIFALVAFTCEEDAVPETVRLLVDALPRFV